MKQKNQEKGITLIALVITIIVLLILAGISISMLSGDNGLLTKTTEARARTIHANVYEQLQLEKLAHLSDKATSKTTSTLIGYLKSKSIIGDEIGEDTGKYQVNVTALLGSSQSLGNGDATEEVKDVYLLEQQSDETTYTVIYYGNKTSENVTLGNLTDNSNDTPVASTDESEKLYNVFKDKTPMEIVNGINIDGIETNFITPSESENDAFIEYNNNVYIVSLSGSGTVSTVTLANNIDFDLNTFGVYEVGGVNVLVTPSTPENLIHTNYDGPKTFTGMYYYDEDTGEFDTTRPFTYGYVAYDSNFYERYYDTSGVLVLASQVV